jgi:hypothetical protein
VRTPVYESLSGGGFRSYSGDPLGHFVGAVTRIGPVRLLGSSLS